MDSQTLFEEDGLECTTWDAPVSDGALKTLIHRRNRTEDEIQPLTICYQNSESYFKVKTKLITCVHGYMETLDETPTRPATLLVLEYRMDPKKGHRFTDIYTSFTFKDASQSLPSSPRVVSYAPFPRPRRFHPSQQTVEKTSGFSANLGVSGGTPVSAGASGDKSTKMTHIQEFFAKGSAGVDPDEDTGVENTIWWKLEENNLQNHGVLDVFRAAVLVERDNLEDFVGVFTLDVQGSFSNPFGSLAEKVRDRFLRRAALDDPVRFSPAKLELQGKFDGIDPGSLGSLVKYTKQGEGIYLPESYDLENALPAEAVIGGGGGTQVVS